MRDGDTTYRGSYGSKNERLTAILLKDYLRHSYMEEDPQIQVLFFLLVQ